MAVVCHTCGHANETGANFCSSCGAHLEEERTATFHPGELADEAEESVPGVLEGATLLVTRGPYTGSRFSLGDGVTTIGRHPDSTIFLDDVTVSRRHVEIQQEAGDYVLRDVGSLNGTYVNRERVEEARLVNGDELQIGKFKLVFFVGG